MNIPTPFLLPRPVRNRLEEALFNPQILGTNHPSPNAHHPPVARGSGHLEVEYVSGESAATAVCASNPLKILVPRPRGPSIWAFLSSFGGGLVAGDEINLTLKLAARTKCFLGTQASTKVYRNPAGWPCGYILKARLGAGAALVVAPDPVQAFAGSSYKQRQEFHLEPASGIVLVDWISAGRLARGERFAFNFLQNRIDVFLAGKRIFLDSLLLDSRTTPISNAPGLNRFNCLASVLILGEPFSHAATQVLQQIAAQPVARRSPLVSSASPLTHGTVIRLAGEHVEEVGREIHRLLAFLPGFLHDDPWARKW